MTLTTTITMRIHGHAIQSAPLPVVAAIAIDDARSVVAMLRHGDDVERDHAAMCISDIQEGIAEYKASVSDALKDTLSKQVQAGDASARQAKALRRSLMLRMHMKAKRAQDSLSKYS